MRITATGITLARGGRAILDDVSIALVPGELTGLIGPNGAGKTTLLRILAGLLAAGAGEVRYDGMAAAEIGRAVLARRLAFLAQGDEVNWPIAAGRLVALGRLPHRGTPAAVGDSAAVARAMAAADVAAFAARPVDALSGGERRRVLLARALAVEGEALLADEPIAALDPYHQLQVMELLAEAAAAGRTVVAVLHDLTPAARFCGRLVLVDRGRIVADGPPRAVLTDAVLAAAYRVAAERPAIADGEAVLPWRRLPAEAGPEEDAGAGPRS